MDGSLKTKNILNYIIELYSISEKAADTMLQNAGEYEEAFKDYYEADIKEAVKKYWRYKNDKTRPKVAHIIAMMDEVKEKRKQEEDLYLQQYGMTFKMALDSFIQMRNEYPIDMYKEIKKETGDGVYAAMCKVNFIYGLRECLKEFKDWFEDNKDTNKFNLNDWNILGALHYQNSPDMRVVIKDKCKEITMRYSPYGKTFSKVLRGFNEEKI